MTPLGIEESVQTMGGVALAGDAGYHPAFLTGMGGTLATQGAIRPEDSRANMKIITLPSTTQ